MAEKWTKPQLTEYEPAEGLEDFDAGAYTVDALVAKAMISIARELRADERERCARVVSGTAWALRNLELPA